ncbi:MAG: UvrD-helicase domain-containing protein [Lepagella sp.]
MLDLYRASAGSGKTYRLARTYIFYLISISDEDNAPRLRNQHELADAARHILAITFTNKATNEMQVRIINSLYNLAYGAPVVKTDDEGRQVTEDVEYMDDFCQTLGETREKIAKACKIALASLLENYSDFRISTIDSFFQMVLRTFAYETNNHDTFQVELDSEYVSKVSVDATLDVIDDEEDPENDNIRFWVKMMMDRANKGWNIFSSSLDSPSANSYKEFVNDIKKLDNEEYKLVRDEVEAYLASKPDLRRLYDDLKKMYEDDVKEAFKSMRKVCHDLYSNLPAAVLQNKGRDLNFIRERIARIGRHMGDLSGKKLVWDCKIKNAESYSLEFDKRLDSAAQSAGYTSDQLKEILLPAQNAFDKWFGLLSSPGFRLWKLYSLNLPAFALFGIVSQMRRDYLNEINAIELSETTMILNKVIGDSDTPFIYERIGTLLNHFLIDEFQDTSRMQWQNLSPLVSQSLSEAHGNLIIGDAKQSIYRFRNADPSLISEKVPQDFEDYVRIHGNDPSENTNYRSDLHVVQFNNSFFKFLAQALDDMAGRSEQVVSGVKRRRFSPLYANVVQTPKKQKNRGFIDIRLIESGKKDKADEYALRQVPELIHQLLHRGYRQRDIALLVSRNKECEWLIDSFTAYNQEHPDLPQISFVSEQSLYISSSKAVSIIVGVLDNIARGSLPKIEHGDGKSFVRNPGKWCELASNFKYYRINHPSASMAEALDDFLQQDMSFDALSELLKNMQSLALPALIEAIASKFLTSDLRREDAVYIAAFQDLVLEYCDGHPTDMRSFLDWWDRKKKKACIASPDDIDAVTVTTVHKSKGLQYECVIVPFVDWEMTDKFDQNKTEWRWVKPNTDSISHDSIQMPPYLPLAVTPDMEDTCHQDILYRFYDEVKMDYLNAAYVAFTRAKSELYIFARIASAKKGKNGSESAPTSRGVGYFINLFLQQLIDGTIPECDDIKLLSKDIVHQEVEEGLIQYTVGSLPECVEVKNEDRSDKIVIEEYTSYESPGFLKTRLEDSPIHIKSSTESEPDGESDSQSDSEPEEDTDPRSEGNLMHALLEMVKRPADLHEAVKYLLLSGVITLEMATQIEMVLTDKLVENPLPEVRRWFGEDVRVVNERPLLAYKSAFRRPDRLVFYPDGSVDVVDYKFGKVDTSGKYRRQVANYVRLLGKSGYTTVRGYLWYVKENQIIKV